MPLVDRRKEKGMASEESGGFCSLFRLLFKGISCTTVTSEWVTVKRLCTDTHYILELHFLLPCSLS